MKGIYDQYTDSINAIEAGGLDALSRVFTDPSSITPNEQRSMADKLGLKNAFLRTAVDVFSDPLVWVSMLLSHKFPTRSWLQGVVPDRFVGHANEFTGVSFFARPVVDYFRGTPIPKLAALKMYREAEVMRAAQPLLRIMERPNWQTEKQAVSLLMEGQSAPGATAELRGVADQARAAMDDMWGFLSRTRRVVGGFDGEHVTRAQAVEWGEHGPPKYLRDYLPHIPNLWLNSEESTVILHGSEALKKLNSGHVRSLSAARGVPPDQVWTAQKSDRLSSEWARYQTFMGNVGAQVFNPHLFKRTRLDMTLEGPFGGELFVTDLDQVFQKYVHSVARSYSLNAPLTDWERTLTSVLREDGTWHRPNEDPLIVQIINQGLDAMGPRLERSTVPGTQIMLERIKPGSVPPLMKSSLHSLVRSMKGQSGPDEIIFGNLFNAVRQKLHNTIGRSMGRMDVEKVDDAIKTFEHNRDYRAVSGGIANFFYGSTLGLNPFSALQNMMQPLITTAPAIGLGSTLAGFREFTGRVPSYVHNVRKQFDLLGGMKTGGVHRLNEAGERAFMETFPELARHGFRVDPRMMEIDEATLLSGKFRSLDDYTKLIMQPFTQAEMANQAGTFFSVRNRLKTAVKTGEMEVPSIASEAGERAMTLPELDEYLNFQSSQATASLQFRPGPGSRSLFQEHLPAPLRQFTSFPTRFLSFAADSTVRGAMTRKQIETAGLFGRLTNGRNLGTAARWYLIGKTTTEGMREALGIDLAGSMLVPFNIAPRGQSLIPLPAPPIAGVTTGLIGAATTGNINKLDPLYLPGIGPVPWPKLLFPGGVAVSRAVRAWQQFRPDMGGFVDDDERLMYQAGTSDLALAMLGIPSDKGRRSRNAIEKTEQMRWRVRDFRRQFAIAQMNYDEEATQRLQAQWSEAFPEMPPLTVDPMDVERYRQQSRLTSVQRMIRTLGRNGKFMEQDLQVYDPDLIAGPDDVSPILEYAR